MKKRLFIFTIGPVQSFIAKARKVIDYKNGSQLLSFLINSIIEEFNQKTRKDNEIYSTSSIIFPSEEIESKPNRFIAMMELKKEDRKSIEELGSHLINYAEGLLKDRFYEIIKAIIKNSSRAQFNPDWREKFDKQLESFLEYYWVSVPIEEMEQYSTQYTDLENWLGAVKNKRVIKQIEPTGERGLKCDLCGERNALLFFKDQRSFASNKAITITNLNKIIMNEKEGLCSICLIKRFFNIKYMVSPTLPPMNSSAGISLGHLLNDNNLRQKFKDYYKIFGKSFDEDYYFEEELLQRSREDEKIQKLKDEALEWFEQNREVFMDTIWSKYYAFILFDGDDMGSKWVSGSFLTDKSNLNVFHEEMSRTLGEYTHKLKEIFERYNGLLVYAGGDDICGFINIIDLWSLLKEMRINYPDFRELIMGDSDDIDNSTASCGVCIAHYKEPLKRVINTARSMEHTAKSVDGKDALSLAILKPSGTRIFTVSKWNLANNGTNNVYITDLAEHIINNLKNQTFSNKFIKNLDLELWWNKEDSTPKSSKMATIPSDLIKLELERLIYRSVLMNSAINNIKKEDLSREDHRINTNILKPLKTLIERMDFNNFCSFLKICEFFKSKQLNYNKGGS